MIKMRPYAPPDRIAIRDSIEEEISDDVEDDVFIRDGRTSKMREEKGLKRPLMAPRQRNNKSGSSIPIMKKRRRCWKCCEPFCYGLAALTILIVLILLGAFILTLFPIPLQRIKLWLKRDSPQGLHFDKQELSQSEFVPCTQISVQRVWSRTFPRINSESPLRKADINGDNVLDIIFAYGTDESVQYEDLPLPKCMSSRQNEELPCEGGVIALNGINGDILWQAWSVGNVFSLLCNVDIDKDGYPDCIAAGAKGLIFAINGRNGNVIWRFRELDVETNSVIVNDLYTINLVRDLDTDGIPDILTVHIEERQSSAASHILLISGKNGKVIKSIATPFREEVFVPMQILVREDGTEYLLIITGGQNTPGGVYAIRMLSLMQIMNEKQFIQIHRLSNAGFMAPAVIADINQDKIEDIIVSSFNSTIYAFDGRNFSMLWNHTFPASESVSSIVPGHFDHDDIVDFMVKYNTGPGFPVYYYSQTTILNGKTGQPLLNSMMTDSGGPNSLLGGVSISQTFGGDFFLHWQLQCRGKSDAKDAYEFIPDSDVNQQTRADTCALRYNTSTILKLYAIARHVEPPGAVIFSSDDLLVRLNRTQYHQVQQQNAISPLKHPKMIKKIIAKEYIASDSQPVASTIHNDEKKKDDREYERNPMKITNFPEQENDRTIYDQVKPYYNIPLSNQPDREFKDYDTEQRNPDEYDILYNDDQQNYRPIRFRSKYPINRGVRSDFSDYDSNDTTTTTIAATTTTINPSKVVETDEQPLNLWDLEMEKEAEEAIKEAHKYDYIDRHKRDNDPKEESDPFLAGVSSTGILLPTLENLNSSIDFAFILNIRESETYPPLLLQQDVNCVEEKLIPYKSLTRTELITLEKSFIRECLQSRLGDYSPNPSKYESQIVITRISITCNCGNLQSGEICSSLEYYNRQRWTEFMGNFGSGLYTN